MNDQERKIVKDSDTATIAKAYMFVTLALEYMELFLLHPAIRRNSKKFLNDQRDLLSKYLKNLQFVGGNDKSSKIMIDFFGKFASENDVMAIDSIFDKLTGMAPEQWQMVEEYCQEIISYNLNNLSNDTTGRESHQTGEGAEDGQMVCRQQTVYSSATITVIPPSQNKRY